MRQHTADDTAVDGRASALPSHPAGEDSHALLQGPAMWPQEVVRVSTGSTLCFLSVADLRTELQLPHTASRVREHKWKAAHRSVPKGKEPLEASASGGER
ncbi:unnamed protein product [Pleuronectes platessa]|uniref:Uncharacterized protein n=1 Tax=Pleuronectes platessa TaxID=8262 RepID=A0A9N7UQS7_PLEPL|nr:unnamed protein product [Pleuronectes platessa]